MDTGVHGFPPPGSKYDELSGRCKDACATPEDPDPCGCMSRSYFDIGMYMMNVMGDFFYSDATRATFDLCNSRNDCSWAPPADFGQGHR